MLTIFRLAEAYTTIQPADYAGILATEFRAVVDFVSPHERAPWVRLRKTPRPPCNLGCLRVGGPLGCWQVSTGPRTPRAPPRPMLQYISQADDELFWPALLQQPDEAFFQTAFPTACADVVSKILSTFCQNFAKF